MPLFIERRIGNVDKLDLLITVPLAEPVDLASTERAGAVEKHLETVFGVGWHKGQCKRLKGMTPGDSQWAPLWIQRLPDRFEVLVDTLGKL